MEPYRIIMWFSLLLFLVVNCAVSELEVNTTNSNNGSDQKTFLLSSDKNGSVVNGVHPLLNSSKIDHEKKGESQIGGGTQEELEKNTRQSNSSNQLGLKEGPKIASHKNDSAIQSQVKEGHTKEKPTEGSDSKLVHEEGNKNGVTVPLEPSRRESSWGEECDSSNRCMDEKSKLVACLRVPGNESPDLSLLIQNKGTSLITINITAPDFVHLEETKVELREKEDKKVKVPIGKVGKDTTIVLTTGTGSCSLDFRDLVLHNAVERIDYSPKSTYAIFLIQVPSIVYMTAAVLLLMASSWICAKFYRRLIPTNSSRYQKLETELPVSGGGKMESDVTDGWDNSWDDDWDDEEAPRTPSKPVTPSLSSKGLATRRVSKEGWKD
ncbi:PREDICTED: uncharacterized protein LOC104603989 [Nelumbo nucifera]|uniref:Uncharacterized protein LOC104603989 n=2 Tax=Nelumbo nucifera TaxID=4432 RepID=A0A1U8AFX5_NELNU|nr:PREDICTED: uncharacterized protein LOC104603989 [Nelumbo nucifera]DAD36290.1 TPA_asm: hypothetical protein HUJ06_006930 [Nelumbo nucifera]